MDKDTQEVMDELRNEGFSFNGDSPEPSPSPEEPEKVIPKEEELKVDEPEAPEIPEEKKEPEKEPSKTLDDEVKIERKPRDQKQVPAWKLAIANKKGEQEKVNKEELKSELRAELLKELRGTLPNKEPEASTDKVKAIAEKHGVSEELVRDLADLFPKRDDTEISEKIKNVEEAEHLLKQETEDRHFLNSFEDEILPKLKEKNPDITRAEIKAVQEKMKEYYFSSKYISLGIDEIFNLKNGELLPLVGEPKRKTIESGKTGGSRGKETIDYENISDEQYANMSFEEQEKVNAYLEKKQRA